MKKVDVWEVVYYLLVIFATWMTTRQGAPLTVGFYYHGYRTSQKVAGKVGRVGIILENRYHREVERTRT